MIALRPSALLEEIARNRWPFSIRYKRHARPLRSYLRVGRPSVTDVESDDESLFCVRLGVALLTLAPRALFAAPYWARILGSLTCRYSAITNKTTTMSKTVATPKKNEFC